MGILDDRYLTVTHDPAAQRGSKISIEKKDVEQVIGALRKIAASMQLSSGGNTIRQIGP
jgi:hypothetical protein